MSDAQLREAVSTASEAVQERRSAEGAIHVSLTKAVQATQSWYQEQDPETQAVVKEVFQSLVTTRQKWTGADKEEEEFIRPRPEWPEDRNAKRAQAKIATIKRLTEAGLLEREDTIFRLAYDAESLCQAWEELHVWLKLRDSYQGDLSTLEEAANDWKKNGRRPDLLWTRGNLKAAVQLLEDRPYGLPPLVQEFINKARARANRSRLRRLAIGLGAFSILALLVSLWLLWGWRAAAALEKNWKDYADGLPLMPSPPIPWDQKAFADDLQKYQVAHEALMKLLHHTEKQHDPLKTLALNGLEGSGHKFLDNYGRMLVRAGNYQEAEVVFAQALEINTKRFERNQDDDSAQALAESYRRMIGLPFIKMKITDRFRESAEYKDADQYNKKGAQVLKKSAAEFAAKGNRLARLESSLAQFDELKTVFPLQLNPHGPVTVEDGELTAANLIFFKDRRQIKDKDKAKCKVYALELEGNKQYTFRLDAKDQAFDPYLLLQNGIYEDIAFSDDFDPEFGLDAQVTVNIQQTGTYRLFAASLTKTGKFVLTITANEIRDLYKEGKELLKDANITEVSPDHNRTAIGFKGKFKNVPLNFDVRELRMGKKAFPCLHIVWTLPVAEKKGDALLEKMNELNIEDPLANITLLKDTVASGDYGLLFHNADPGLLGVLLERAIRSYQEVKEAVEKIK